MTLSTSIRFDVYDMTSSYRTYIGERETFDEAEHLARWHAARRGVRIVVDKIVTTTRHRYSEEMASVSRDPLGRLWTDLTWHGATFV